MRVLWCSKMAIKISLQVLGFSPKQGLVSLYEDDFTSIVKDPSQEVVLSSLFPNYILGVVTQGGAGITGLHGPFTVGKIPNLLALAYVFFTKRKSSDSQEEDFGLLICYYDSTLDQYITPTTRQQISSALEGWKSEILTKETITEQDVKRLRKMLIDIFQQAQSEMVKALLQRGVGTTLANSLIQVNSILTERKKSLKLAIFSENQILDILNPLIFTALFEMQQLHKANFVYSPTSASSINFGNFELSYFPYVKVQVLEHTDVYIFAFPPRKDIQKYFTKFVEFHDWSNFHYPTYFLLDSRGIDLLELEKTLVKVKKKNKRFDGKIIPVEFSLKDEQSIMSYHIIANLLVEIALTFV